MAAKKAAKKAGNVAATPAEPVAPGATDTKTVAPPAVAAPVATVETPKGADLSFAVNATKLNRAKAYVQKVAPDAKGAQFAALVKERYIELGGLLAQNKPTPGVRRGKMNGGQIVNLADDDGSKD